MLFTPGPVDVHPSVLAASAQPPLHHRSAAFIKLSARVWSGLQTVFQTEHPVLIQAGSAMTGIESAIASLHGPGDSVLVLSHGRFGDRLREIADRYGLSVIFRHVPWGESFTAEAVADIVSAHPYVQAVWMVHAETSTAVALPLEQIALAIRQHAPQALIAVDAVTSVGVQAFAMDAWGIDVAVAGIQKGLSCPPGLALTALSERAQERLQRSKHRPYTLDLSTVLRDLRRGLFTWTPPVTLVAALDRSLHLILEDGLETTWNHHAERHALIIRWAQQHGLTLFGNGTATGVVAIVHPRSQTIVADLATKYGISIAAGQDAFSEHIFRIGTMGFRRDTDLQDLITALDTILSSS